MLLPPIYRQGGHTFTHSAEIDIRGCGDGADDDGHLLAEEYSGGPLSSLRLTNFYDALGRRTAVGLPTLSTNLTQYTYDAASRLRTVSNGLFSATYNYLANSPLVEQIDCRHQGHDRMMTGRTFDHLNRLTRVLAVSTNGALLSFAYGYNRAGQRTNAVLADGSHWQYQYDPLGQLTSGKRHWSDGAPVAAQQWEYLFDAIGNRTLTKAGGDPSGSALRPASYQVDAANQYTQRDVPRTNDVIGAAPAAATVVVNGVTNQNRHGEYFWTALGTNQSGAFWLPVTVTASQGATNETSTGHLFLPATPEVFTHDLDGNLTGDGRWTYTWDAENRLLSMETLSAATNAGAPRQNIAFTYDWQGRRIRKTVSNWISGDWSLITHHRFIYDGWNLLAILDQTNGLVQSFTWGLDASGTMQGAGGVGGLLAMTVHTGPNAGTYFYCYDGNWNVVALINATNGALAARYEYGPFHELLRATGPLARHNPFLAATKYYDWETGLYYYGHRYYNPSIGRWLSRDPVEEMQRSGRSAENLYSFSGNDAVNHWDFLGWWRSTLGMTEHEDLTASSFRDVWKKATNTSPCVGKKLLSVITAANVATDGGATGNEGQHHYLRGMGEFADAAREAYVNHVRTEVAQYGKLLEEPDASKCVEALKRLGHISHEWQDYYAHAIGVDSPYQGNPGPIAGNPDNPSKNLKPALWGNLMNWQEHGESEPAWREADRGLDRRTKATSFVTGELPASLGTWLAKCSCYCTKKWP